MRQLPEAVPVSTDTARRLEAVAVELEQLRGERDLLIVQRRAEGASLAEIAAEAGLTRQGINDALRRLGQR